VSNSCKKKPDKAQDNCAVVGIYLKKNSVAELAKEMLIELNHRGQESSGIATANGSKIVLYKNFGLAENIFSCNKNLPKPHHAIIAVGHNRYSTSGSLEDNQPFVYHDIILSHNGNLTNIHTLKKLLVTETKKKEPISDSWYALKLIAQNPSKDLTDKVYQTVTKLEGAFSFIIASKDTLIAVRDPWGFRPLVFGKLGAGYVFASETTAIYTVGGKVIRSILPGEIVTIKKGTVYSTIYSHKDQARCIFELIYIQRPDSVFDEVGVEKFRMRCGAILARKAPVAVDAVVAVPRSGISAAIGLSEESKIPYREGLYTNPYRGAVYGHRTFIRPNGRERAAAEKYSILYDVIRENPRIILVDDSIVRGVTMKELIIKLRKAGAYEIHLRIASPPLKSGCYMGVDFGASELFAAKQTSMEKRRKFLGVDSLVYLTPAEMVEAALGNPIEEKGKHAFAKYGFCGACFTGNYPISLKRKGLVVKT
jgi:amidophosphoribosyltransferase